MVGLIPKLGGLIGAGVDACKDNSSAILTGLAVGGVILTAVLAARAVPRAMEAVEEEREERKRKAEKRAEKESEVLGADYDEVYEREYEEMSGKDIVKCSIRYFVPAILSGTITVACIVGAHHIDTVKQAALAASYETLRNSFDTYRYHVKEEVDKKKFEEIERKYEIDRANQIMDRRPLSGRDCEKLDVESGAAIFVEPTTGHAFVSTYEKVNSAADEVNDMVNPIDGGYSFVSIGRFLEMAGDKSNDYPKIAEKWGFMAGGYSSKRIDKNHLYNLLAREYKGHMCTLVYLHTDYQLGELDDKSFTR